MLYYLIIVIACYYYVTDIKLEKQIFQKNMENYLKIKKVIQNQETLEHMFDKSLQLLHNNIMQCENSAFICPNQEYIKHFINSNNTKTSIQMYKLDKLYKPSFCYRGSRKKTNVVCRKLTEPPKKYNYQIINEFSLLIIVGVILKFMGYW